MTPCELKVLLHCQTSDTPPPNLDIDTVNDAIGNLLADHVIYKTDKPSVYKVTQKGAAWLALILNTQQPIQAWVDNNGKIIRGFDNDKD